MNRITRSNGILGLFLALAITGCVEKATVKPDLAMAGPDCVAHPELCTGGACTSDSFCVAIDPSRPRCAFDGSCVQCLPDKDTCPTGEVCHQTNGVWACGTKCAADIDCTKLGGGSVCCSEFCVNPATSVSHCGGCGNLCPPVINGGAACVEGNCVIGDCNPGYSDCDKAQINGCETSTTSDALNCGMCGSACKPFPNGLPTCAASKCAAICAPGFADCDGNTINGCEVDTTYDIAACGGCGKTCAAPTNALAACDQGKCSKACKLGFADCDGNPGNGCEVNTGTDAVHCGHCGNTCPLRPNAMGAECKAGKCANTCNQGFGDCDNRPENGCEADLSNSLAACGACGKPCSANNATPACSQGMCSVQCKPGFLDCNNDGTDGCESNPQSDPKNCAGCGNVCPQNTPFCSKGVCGDKGLPCSMVAMAWCLQKGFSVPVGGEAKEGRVYCTKGLGTGSNCNTCVDYNIIVWVNGAKEMHCAGNGYSTIAGRFYAGHNPCACGDNLIDCGVWDSQNCTPD